MAIGLEVVRYPNFAEVVAKAGSPEVYYYGDRRTNLLRSDGGVLVWDYETLPHYGILRDENEHAIFIISQSWWLKPAEQSHIVTWQGYPGKGQPLRIQLFNLDQMKPFVAGLSVWLTKITKNECLRFGSGLIASFEINVDLSPGTYPVYCL
ncbi:MAG: hypothetical protein AAFV33_04850 [Chloroflexota bacterium]